MNICPICLIPLNDADCFTTECNHGFCKECIITLLLRTEKNTSLCPICRAPLISKVSIEEEHTNLSLIHI